MSEIFWLAGMCVTGFLFLAAWCWIMRDEISKRVTHEALEKRLQRIEEPITEIRNALLGDMNTEGLISKERRRDERCIVHRLFKKEIEQK